MLPHTSSPRSSICAHPRTVLFIHLGGSNKPLCLLLYFPFVLLDWVFIWELELCIQNIIQKPSVAIIVGMYIKEGDWKITRLQKNDTHISSHVHFPCAHHVFFIHLTALTKLFVSQFLFVLLAWVFIWILNFYTRYHLTIHMTYYRWYVRPRIGEIIWQKRNNIHTSSLCFLCAHYVLFIHLVTLTIFFVNQFLFVLLAWIFIWSFNFSLRISFKKFNQQILQLVCTPNEGKVIWLIRNGIHTSSVQSSCVQYVLFICLGASNNNKSVYQFQKIEPKFQEFLCPSKLQIATTFH